MFSEKWTPRRLAAPQCGKACLTGEKKSSVVLRFVNGLISRRIIDFLKSEGHTSSLEKLRHELYRRGHEYSLWDHHPNVRLLTSESMFMQRVHYPHQNPVRLGLVERVDDYRYSSVRVWNRNPFEDEPLKVDIDQMKWRTGGAASRSSQSPRR